MFITWSMYLKTKKTHFILKLKHYKSPCQTKRYIWVFTYWGSQTTTWALCWRAWPFYGSGPFWWQFLLRWLDLPTDLWAYGYSGEETKKSQCQLLPVDPDSSIDIVSSILLNSNTTARPEFPPYSPITKKTESATPSSPLDSKNNLDTMFTTSSFKKKKKKKT